MKKNKNTGFRRAFTLVEVLVTLVVLSVLAGTVGLARSAFETDGDLPRKEALKLAQWLTNIMTISNRSGRSFSLICPGGITQGFLKAEWQIRCAKKPTPPSTAAALADTRVPLRPTAFTRLNGILWCRRSPSR
jgi:prepilin-type N-terminal cleavage/methylation domain-containing protein